MDRLQEYDPWDRTLEEQLKSDICLRACRKYSEFQDGEYNSDTEHLDGDLPHGIQVIYDHGPTYSCETYLPGWHYDTAVKLLDESYEQLINRFSEPPRTE